MSKADNAELVKTDRSSMHHRDQMFDAQSQCLPCKLCGGRAVIDDAGTGAGYYISCENHGKFKKSEGCLIGQNRLGGWAYNVMEWWNRLAAPDLPDSGENGA